MQYELERRQFALDLISFDRKFAAQVSSNVLFKEFSQYAPSFRRLSACHLTLPKFRALAVQSAFMSGLMIQYSESAIVNSTHQSAAKNIIVGQRMPPQVLLRVADARPYELHDLLTADSRFKILAFVGDNGPLQSSQSARVERLADELEAVLAQLSTNGGWERVVELIAISSRKLADMDYTDVPSLLRSHWSKSDFIAAFSGILAEHLLS